MKTDKKYEKKRNALIPEAERYANEKYGVKFKGGSESERKEWFADWNRTFHGKMNLLWKEVRDGSNS